jgi:hypothetical protein
VGRLQMDNQSAVPGDVGRYPTDMHEHCPVSQSQWHDRMSVSQTYAPNVDPSDTAVPMPAKKSSLPIWMAAVWVIALFLLLPAVNVNRNNPPPPGTFLVFQIAITLISFVTGSLLLLRPRKRWLLINVPFVIFLAVVTGTVWTHFP